MSEERIRILLQGADETAPRPTFGLVDPARIRRRLHRRWVARSGVLTSAAAVVAIAAVLWAVRMRPQQAQPEPQKIASLEAQVRQLQAQTDATLRLLQEVIQKDRQERHLASLEAELARIPDPAVEIERQIDQAAFLLIYQADKAYQQHGQTASAVAAYRQVIELFPKSRGADVARERLAEIEKRQINKSDTQGEPRWKSGTV